MRFGLSETLDNLKSTRLIRGKISLGENSVAQYVLRIVAVSSIGVWF